MNNVTFEGFIFNSIFFTFSMQDTYLSVTYMTSDSSDSDELYDKCRDRQHKRSKAIDD
jgi:hypothetical protein